MHHRCQSRVVMIAAAILLGLPSCRSGEQNDDQARARVLVDVGGYRLETVLLGQGEPTVVFEAGFIGGIGALEPLQSAVATRTRTLAYERAGLGGSDPGPEPRAASQIAQELHALLGKVGVEGPLLIVGHSAGGMFARVFASRYAHQVAGLVLVDPSTEDAYEHWRTTDPAHWAGFEQEVRTRYDPPLGWYGQWRALGQSIEEAQRAWPLPPVPVVLFTALVPMPEGWSLANEERIEFWLAAHRKLAGRIPGANHVIVDSADHISILAYPGLQTTILEMVEAARSSGRSDMERPVKSARSSNDFESSIEGGRGGCRDG